MKSRMRAVRRRALCLSGLLALALLTGGCPGAVETFFGAAGVASSGFAVWQRFQDRQVQKEQNKQIDALTDEIKAHRLKSAAAYVCTKSLTTYGGIPIDALLCQPVEK